MRKLEAVIFDWAGTTVDYGCFAPVHAFIEIFKAFGIEASMEEVRKPMGMLKRDHIRTMLNMPEIRKQWEKKYGRSSAEQDVDALYQLFEEKLLGILENFTDVKPGVGETVKLLRKKGIRIGSTTGYTDKMMEIVVRGAAAGGYQPDAWFSPDSTGSLGRPYPYMIYRNMEAFGVSSVNGVVKAGDTISDIREGKNAGVYTIGIVEGSSEMGLTEAEYQMLAPEEKRQKDVLVKEKYMEAGADAVIRSMDELLPCLEQVFVIS